MITITKADQSVEWGTFRTAWIPVEAVRGRRVEISLSLKIDSLVPYNEREADFFRPKIMFYPDTKTMRWKGNCGEVFLDRFKQPIGWTDLKYEVDVPLQAKVALLSFPFGDVDGVVHLCDVRISSIRSVVFDAQPGLHTRRPGSQAAGGIGAGDVAHEGRAGSRNRQPGVV